MLCKKPYWKGVQAYGCGQCLFCRINKRRLWTHRIYLESLMHSENSFITLTYDNDHLPENGSLNPKHLQDFIKRLRKNYGKQLRYFAVGEYGDKTSRPHYHVAAFGIDYENAAIGKSWKFGHIHVGQVTKDSATYIAGYTVKKLDQKNSKLGNRYPEFARMSRKPGIGATAIEKLGQDFVTKEGSVLIGAMLDVPSSISHDGKSYPLGRYLKQRLRDEIGIENLKMDTPEARQKTEEMRILLESHKIFPRPLQAHEKTEILNSVNRQKHRNVEGKYRIFNQRNKI